VASNTSKNGNRRPASEWRAIRAVYEANGISIRAIGRQHGISHEAIRQRAAAEGWTRQALPDSDKAAQIAPVSLRAGPAPDPKVIVDRGRDLALRLLDELDATTAHLGEIEAAIMDETAGDADGRRRQAMLRAIDLQRRSSILKDLASAQRTLGDAAPSGKKEAAAEAAGRAATGRYATPATPPKLVVNNGAKR
jgi:hypothetical protein